MPTGSHTHVIGACTGLCGFVIALIAGLAAGNPFDVILTRALLAMGVTFVIGLGVGALAEHAFGTALRTLRDRQSASRSASEANTPPASASSSPSPAHAAPRPVAA